VNERAQYPATSIVSSDCSERAKSLFPRPLPEISITIGHVLPLHVVIYLTSRVHAANARARFRSSATGDPTKYVALDADVLLDAYSGKCQQCKSEFVPAVCKDFANPEYHLRPVIDRVDVTESNYGPSNWAWLCFGCNATKANQDTRDHLSLHIKELEAVMILASGFSPHIAGTHAGFGGVVRVDGTGKMATGLAALGTHYNHHAAAKWPRW
jgi:hypothetical protein